MHVQQPKKPNFVNYYANKSKLYPQYVNLEYLIIERLVQIFLCVIKHRPRHERSPILQAIWWTRQVLAHDAVNCRHVAQCRESFIVH